MCPHCNRSLPEEATFCNECGRRVEGWHGRVDGTAPSSDTELADGELETREMQVTPGMLRAAGKQSPDKKVKQPDQAVQDAQDGPSDSVMLRAIRGRPWKGRTALAGIAVAAGVGVFWAIRPQPLAPPAPGGLAAPVAVSPPTQAAPSALLTGTKSKRRAPKKLAAEAVNKGVVDGSKEGPLPKKTTATDSKPVASAKKSPDPLPSGSAPAPNLPDEDLPSSATPMTDEELKQQEEGRLNADQVRYVVKQHLSQVRACYERQFKQESPGGRVEITFAIGEDGKARRIRTDLNTTGQEPFGRCIEGLIGSWTFPRPVGGEFELTYPFVFSSGS